MIDVTATMLPSTVMNDRSLAPQIASSAIPADSRSLFMRGHEGLERRDRQDGPNRHDLILDLPAFPACPAQQESLPFCRVHFYRVAVGHTAHRVVGAGDDLIAGLQAGGHF